MYPRLADFLPITNYGILVTAGFLLGLWVTLRLSRSSELERPAVLDVAIWGLLWGLVGAKVALILLNLESHLRDPASLLGVLRYAGIFYGGLAASLLFILVYTRRHGISFFQVTDLFAPGTALAHALGRVGCFLAGCCYGSRCDLPWAVTFTSEAANEQVGTPLHVPLHPVQLYEAGGNLVIFVLLLMAWRLLRRRTGVVTGFYVALYAASRFTWEFFRADPRGSLGPLTTSQWAALAAVALLAVAAAVLWRRGRPSGGAAGSETD